MGMTEVGIKLNMDTSSFVSSAQNVADAFNAITEKIKEAQEAGDDASVERYTKTATALQGTYNKMATTGTQVQGQGVDTVQSVSNVANTATTATQSVISQAGGGDPFGAGITGVRGALDVGSQISRDIGGEIGGKVAAGLGIAGLALLPLTIGNQLASFYETQITSAMDTNAVLNNTMRRYDEYGNPLETAEERKEINTENIRLAFDSAAKSAKAFGYSMEEGMSLVKEATAYGYNAGDVYGTTKNIFGWSRMTGVDTGTLLDYKGTSHRYGDTGDALATAFNVNAQMGMGRGQYSETLSAMGRIFEDGISKGFVKSTADIGSTLIALYQASGKSALWQGEQGANRYLQMSNSMSSATDMSSVTDILMYRAASSLTGGDPLKTYMLMEKGPTPELLTALKKQYEAMAGKGNERGLVELYKSAFGLNYTKAMEMYEMQKSGITAPEKSIASSLTPEYSSSDLDMLEVSESSRKAIADMGKKTAAAKQTISAFVINTASGLDPVVSLDLAKKGAFYGSDDPGNKSMVKKALEEKKQRLEDLQNTPVVGDLLSVFIDFSSGIKNLNEKIAGLNKNVGDLTNEMKKEVIVETAH